MDTPIDIAVVGATGLVGEMMREILAEREFPIRNFYPVASRRSKGTTIDFCGKPYEVEALEDFDFSKVQIALFSAGGELSAQYAPKAAAANCVVIDNTPHFRYDPDVPLVIPEVNPEAIADYQKTKIIANPNCSTIQMLVALKPIYDNVGIKRITVSTYQAVSGSGRKAVNELMQQVTALLSQDTFETEAYPHQIAFNLIPQIDTFQANGYTKEEMKMVWETQKILDDEFIQVNPTAVRVPVFYGHSEAIHVEMEKPLTAEAAKQLIELAPGVTLCDAPEDLAYPMPVTHTQGQDEVFVGRIRQDLDNPNGLNLWVVGDNIRKGAALNAVQIAEILHREHF